MTTQVNRPGIGVAMLVWKDENRHELLIGRGHNSAEHDIYALAGGYLEAHESLVEGAIREAREEAGVEVRSPRLLTVYEFFNRAKQRTFVTVAFEAIWQSGEPRPEPGKRLSWQWATLSEALSLPLFESDEVLLNNVKDRFLYRPGSQRCSAFL